LAPSQPGILIVHLKHLLSLRLGDGEPSVSVVALLRLGPSGCGAGEEKDSEEQSRERTVDKPSITSVAPFQTGRYTFP
jgi:hypothetical protein